MLKMYQCQWCKRNHEVNDRLLSTIGRYRRLDIVAADVAQCTHAGKLQHFCACGAPWASFYGVPESTCQFLKSAKKLSQNLALGF